MIAKYFKLETFTVLEILKNIFLSVFLACFIYNYHYYMVIIIYWFHTLLVIINSGSWCKEDTICICIYLQSTYNSYKMDDYYVICIM